jgi:pyruvate ferredoxin oxidoreductase delta subunit
MTLKSWKEIPIGGLITKQGSSQNNKTGSWKQKKPVISLNDCIKCGRCVSACPERSIKLEDKKIEINYDYCKGCGLCVNECPKKAIKLI